MRRSAPLRFPFGNIFTQFLKEQINENIFRRWKINTANMENHNYKGDPAGSTATTCPLEPCPMANVQLLNALMAQIQTSATPAGQRERCPFVPTRTGRVRQVEKIDIR